MPLYRTIVVGQMSNGGGGELTEVSVEQGPASAVRCLHFATVFVRTKGYVFAAAVRTKAWSFVS